MHGQQHHSHRRLRHTAAISAQQISMFSFCFRRPFTTRPP